MRVDAVRVVSAMAGCVEWCPPSPIHCFNNRPLVEQEGANVTQDDDCILHG